MKKKYLEVLILSVFWMFESTLFNDCQQKETILEKFLFTTKILLHFIVLYDILFVE